MNFANDKQFTEAVKELDNLKQIFFTQGVTKEYSHLWPQGTIMQLLSIPRTSAQFIYNLIMIKKPKNILELGTCAGYSTIWIAKAAESYSKNIKDKKQKAKVYTIEQSKPDCALAAIFFKKAKLANIKQINSYIEPALNSLPENKMFDFVFMDADKKNYLKYLKLLEPHLNKNATIVADNVISHKHLMFDYLNYLEKNSIDTKKQKAKYTNELIEMDNGMMVSVFNGK